jgi:sulfur carrier protein
MEITINGQSKQVPADYSLGQLVSELFLPGTGTVPAQGTPKGVAVAINQSVIPKSDWPSRRLSPNDHITLITATQGG